MGVLSKIWNRQQPLAAREAQQRRMKELMDQLRQIPTGQMLMQLFDEKNMRAFFRTNLDCLGKYKPTMSVQLSTR